MELKSRRIAHDRYPTTIITRGKLNFCSDPTKRYYIAYYFSDGLYIIKYDKDLFETFNYDNNYQRTPRYGVSNNPQSIVYIPVDLLVKVD